MVRGKTYLYCKRVLFWSMPFQSSRSISTPREDEALRGYGNKLQTNKNSVKRTNKRRLALGAGVDGQPYSLQRSSSGKLCASHTYRYLQAEVIRFIVAGYSDAVLI